MTLKRNNLFLFYILVFIMAVSACQEDDGNLGMNVLPVTDSTSFFETDTTTLRSFTIPGERATDAGLHNLMLGTYSDPVFGESKADFATKFYPSNFSFPYDEKSIIDSVKLQLRYSEDTIGKYFGRRSSEISYRIYQLKTQLEEEERYHPDSIDFGKNAIAQGTFSPLQLNDTLLTIELSRLFAENLSDTTKSSSYTSTSAFSEAFPGLYMKTEEVEDPGVLAYFDPYHKDSKITVYYQNTAESDTLEFDYPFKQAYCANLFSHDYNSTPVGNKLTEEPLQQDTITYIQGMGGTRGLIRLPYLNKWRNSFGDKTILINKAELIVKPTAEQQPGVGLVKKPYELILMRRNENGIKYPINEYLTPQAYLGETAREETGYYRFTITNYFQKLINNELPNNGMYLMVRNKNEDAGRMLINGGAHQQNAMEVVIRYGLL